MKKAAALLLSAALLTPSAAMAAERTPVGTVAEEETVKLQTEEEKTEAESENETVVPQTEEEKEGSSLGCMLRRFVLYRDGEAVMNVDSLTAELDFAVSMIVKPGR